MISIKLLKKSKMNRFHAILLLLVFTSLQSCKNSTETPKVAIIEIIDKEFGFGQISMKDSTSFTFTIKNKSEIPFKISKVGTSCGCTTTEYTKDEVSINEFAIVELLFKPNQIGHIEKSIVVESNTDPPFNVFYIKGDVVE